MPSLEELSDGERLQLARAANQVLNNPETRREFQKLWKKANPKVTIPEVDQEDKIASELKERDKAIEELRAKQIQDSAERRRSEEHERAKQLGLDPSDVEKAVVDRKIMDWDAAMEFVQMQQQIAASTPSSEGSSPVKRHTDNKELWENPAQWARDRTIEAIDELRGRRGLKRRA